jgi:hypothetical protein
MEERLFLLLILMLSMLVVFRHMSAELPHANGHILFFCHVYIYAYVYIRVRVNFHVYMCPGQRQCLYTCPYYCP